MGDPCYVLGREATGRPGVDYEAVVAAREPVVRLAGQPVLLLQDFGGDGSFPIFGEYEDGMLMRVVVEFVEAEE